MAGDDTHRQGRWAEDVACEYLRARGLQTVVRNFRGRRGEIDLIMRLGDVLVFVEVRYRTRQSFGSGAETVGARKQARLVATARQFLQRNPQDTERTCRFDVISISGRQDAPRIQWIENAFEA